MPTPLGISAAVWRAVHQPYVEVPSLDNVAALSVRSFEAHESLGDPYHIVVQVSCPVELWGGDIIGSDATFRMVPGVGTPRRFAGCVTAWSRLQYTSDSFTYRAVIEPHVARLRYTLASRIFQQQTTPAIIESLLRRHGFKEHQFVFRLRRDYPEHAFRMQYRCSDWYYLRVLMEQEGIYCYFDEGDHGDRLVFGDDTDHYLYRPMLTLPYCEPTGLGPSRDTIVSLRTHATMVAQTYRIADTTTPCLAPDRSEHRVLGHCHLRPALCVGFGHRDLAQATWEARLRHEAAIATQVVHDGSSTSMDVRPARIVHTDERLDDTPHGMVITDVIHTGAWDQPYRNTFRAIPADRRFRLPLDEAAWPRIAGTLSAYVTPPDETCLTRAGYYSVCFDLDSDDTHSGGQRVPLRLARPFSSQPQTGMHFPPVSDGDEAVIAFRDGDPNKPYIAAFHRNSSTLDPITHQDRWMSCNVIYTQADNKLEMEGSEGHGHVKPNTEHSGKSQLTPAQMIDGERQKRGEGAELRTSGCTDISMPGRFAVAVCDFVTVFARRLHSTLFAARGKVKIQARDAAMHLRADEDTRMER